MDGSQSQLHTSLQCRNTGTSRMRKLVQSGGISVNKEKLTDQDMVIDCSSLLDEKYLLVQRGKKNYYLLIVK
jgi:tyrosyl-tRNA synthetase